MSPGPFEVKYSAVTPPAFTLASFSFSHLGVMKYRIPSNAPGRVTPRIRRMTRTT